LLNQKRAGKPIAIAKKPAPGNVVSLMDALRASLSGPGKPAATKKPARAPAKKSTKKRKAG
jgi:DNA end-binding protein Ku